MSIGQLLRPSHRSRCFGGCGTVGLWKNNEFEDRRSRQLIFSPSPCPARRDLFTLTASNQILKPLIYASHGHKCFPCHSFPRPECVNDIVKFTGVDFSRSHDILHEYPLLFQLVPAFGIIAFAVWGLEPVLRLSRKLFHRNDDDWKKSRTRHTLNSYLQPLLLWIGVILICRSLDPISLTSEASQAIKQRLLNFVKSLSTVLAFAFCVSRLVEQIQKFYMDQFPTNDTRNMGLQFVGKAIYSVMWVAAISLFMELLGFSTQKWLTAGGLGTVLLTLAGREIFTNFLSSLMIHATRPFVANDWIQTKIEGYEVSGTIERVGWWSPTVVRGEDQEAIHVPNLKFTMNVIRNLSQKMHWRIKTHIAVSHLDANKISNIVADMRKVLAKNPQIEQQRIHRRVFLDYIDTENQAFMILISCFVRTSHFEEYLRVKEVVLLDLLRVIRHHRARLATPVRTYQKASNDTNLEDVPSETNFYRRRHPLYLLDTSSTMNGGDKTKRQNSPSVSVEQPPHAAGGPEQKAADVIAVDSNTSNMDKQVVISDKIPSASRGPTTNSDDGGHQGNGIKDDVSEKKIPTASKPGPESSTCKEDAADRKSVSQVEAENGLAKHLDSEQLNGQPQSTTQSKKESERTQTGSTPASRALKITLFWGWLLRVRTGHFP